MYQRTEGWLRAPWPGDVPGGNERARYRLGASRVPTRCWTVCLPDLFATAREGPVSDAPAHGPPPLHTAVAPYGRVLLEDRLKHPRGGRKPVVFIGEFGEPGVGISADRHATLQGERGGAPHHPEHVPGPAGRGAPGKCAQPAPSVRGVHPGHARSCCCVPWPLVRRKGKGYSLLAWAGCARWPSSDEPEDPGQEKSFNWRSLVFRATRKHLGDLLLDLLPTALVFLLFLLLENGLDQHVNLAACLLYFSGVRRSFGHLHSPPSKNLTSCLFHPDRTRWSTTLFMLWLGLVAAPLGASHCGIELDRPSLVGAPRPMCLRPTWNWRGGWCRPTGYG